MTWRESFKSEDEAETVNQKQSIKARWNLKPDGMSEFFNLDKKSDALRPVMINTCFYLVLVSRSNRVRAFDCKVRSLRVQSQLFPIGFLGYKFAWKNWDLKLFSVRRHCTKIEKIVFAVLPTHRNCSILRSLSTHAITDLNVHSLGRIKKPYLCKAVLSWCFKIAINVLRREANLGSFISSSPRSLLFHSCSRFSLYRYVLKCLVR